MKLSLSLFVAFLSSCPLFADYSAFPYKIQQIMEQPKYQHSSWGILVKDLQTGRVIHDLDSNKMFLPASTTKLFSVAALFNAYGTDYRFRTPVFATGSIEKGVLNGNLILLGQGDLTFGGRQESPDKITFTNLDHIVANNVPGVTLTPQDPLTGLNELAKQVKDQGIKQINGWVLVDDRLFKSVTKRDMTLDAVVINENLIDIVINPTKEGEMADFTWRPNVSGYSVSNQVKTVAKGTPVDIQVSSDDSGKEILIQGSIPIDQKNIVRTSPIKDPAQFAGAAFIQALRNQGVVVNSPKGSPPKLPPQDQFKDTEPVATFVSPPISEYVKLVLKVSQNYGADLIPLLLAARKNESTFDEGMREFGNFVAKTVKISPDAFVFIDGAGGDANRVTPQAEIQLLEYMKSLPSNEFEKFYNALPILGVDGSLADFAKKTDAVGKVRAKPGTGISLNLATGKFFLTTQVLTGYIEGKNGHLLEFMVAVNNAKMPEIDDIFPIFEDLSQITASLYDHSDDLNSTPIENVD